MELSENVVSLEDQVKFLNERGFVSDDIEENDEIVAALEAQIHILKKS